MKSLGILAKILRHLGMASSSFKSNLQHFIVFILAICFYSSCRPVKIVPGASSPVQIEVGPGVEDIFFSMHGGDSLLWASCDARRESQEPQAEIWTIDVNQNAIDAGVVTKIWPRKGEPAGMVFHPHGIWIEEIDGQKMLWVISHDDEKHQHFVVQYAMEPAHLQYVRTYASPLLNSPNSVCALPDGSLLVTNDSRKRHTLLEKALALKVMNVVHIQPNGEAQIVADRISYTNGINRKGNTVYVTGTTHNRLFAYDWDGKMLQNRRKIAKIPGPDNLRWHGEDELLVACHSRSFAFLGHAKNPEKDSPTQVYAVNVKTGEKRVIYGEKGEHISAASTGVIVGKYLYIGQVFEGWVLAVEVE